MHKRSEISDGIWVVLSAIIAVVGLLLLFPLIGETKEVTESLTDYQICKDGNLLKAKNKIKAIDWINKEEGVNHCTTQQVLVPKDKEYETITKNMALCKDQFLLGTEEVFPSKDANYCAFCSVLEFEDQSKKLNGLTNYLATTKMPGTDTYYLTYFSDIDVKEEKITHLENLELNNVKIDTSKKLAIMFVMYKDAFPGVVEAPKSVTAFGSGVGGTVAGGIVMGLSYFGGIGLCSTLIGCSVGVFLIGGASGMTGYLIGSDRGADWRARLLVTEYNKENLKQLDCTQLEGKDSLKIQEK